MQAELPFGFAIILGTHEIASAIAVRLYRKGFRVVLSHDPLVPVLRRRMAFHDALFDDAVAIEGVPATRLDGGVAIRAMQVPGIIITELGLLDLIIIDSIDILVDARLHPYAATPDLRRLAGLSIGLGPGFAGAINCDVAVETRPGKAGLILRHGGTDPPDGIAAPLGPHGGERFVRAEVAGRWNTAIEIGTRVFKNFVIGHLGTTPVLAPFDGILRGVVRDGTEVPAGAKLIELDGRGRAANWTEIDDRGRQIADAVAEAVIRHDNDLADSSVAELSRGSSLHLVK